MLRSVHWLRCTAALLTVLAAQGAALAAPVPTTPGESPLAVVPAQAPIVAQLRGVERTKDRLLALIKEALPEFAPAVSEQVENALKEGLEGRKLQGLDPAGPHFLAFLEMPTPDTEKPVAAVLARVTRYAQFRDGLLTDDERKSVKPDP